MNNEGPFVIYRWFDRSGRLIYLGMTNRPLSRPEEHVRTKPWVADCVTMTLEHLNPSWGRARAHAYELACIRAEHPRENRAGVQRRRPRTAPRRKRSPRRLTRALRKAQEALLVLTLVLGALRLLIAVAGLLAPVVRL